MKRLLATGALALSLGGCATVQSDWQKLTQASISPSAVSVDGNVYDALEATATNYLNFCKANRALPVCASYVAARKEILPAVRGGRTARNNLETFLAANPGQLGPQGLYDAVTTAIKTVQTIINQYQIPSVVGATK